PAPHLRGALPRPAPARRGASLRHHLPPLQAGTGHAGQRPGRHPRPRPGPAARPAGPVRDGLGDPRGERGTAHGGRRDRSRVGRADHRRANIRAGDRLGRRQRGRRPRRHRRHGDRRDPRGLSARPVHPDPEGAPVTEESIPSPTTDTRGDVVIITGLAGAGRETAAHALEDMGWYVVYNIAPQLIGTLYELQASAVGRENRFAVVVDPRSGPFFTELGEVVDELRKADLRLRLLFLTADESP